MMLFVIVPLWLIALVLFLSSKDVGKVLAMLGTLDLNSPFAFFTKVSGGRCYYLQFMKDTVATSPSTRSGSA